MFEGLDSAGKGGTIRRITERTSPRVFKHIALPTPTEREKSQMYIQRYIAHFPAAGEVAIFDRSWYNRAGVEPVMGYCTPEQTERFLEQVPAVEKAMVDNGIILIKYWLNVSVDEQTRRLENRIEDPRKIWKLSPTDLKSYSRHYEYCRARDAMFAATDTAWAPWFVVDNDDKKRGRLNIISHLLSQIPYDAAPAAGRQDAQEAERPADTSSPTFPCTASRRRSSARHPQQMTEKRTAMTDKPRPGTGAAPADGARRAVVRALGRRGRREARRRPRQRACRRRRPPSCWRRTAPTRCRPRSRRRAGRSSWPSTSPTCRSSSWRPRSRRSLIGQITTGLAVLLITALNALGGLRQQGKAESAMNALQSMLKTTARVRRDGTEVKVDADQVVVGDVVLLAAGDDVCADGRLIEATSLQIDESALTGESVPASKSADVVTDENPVLGDQSNMAFMNTPVTHGSGVMIVTGTGADTAVGNDLRDAEVGARR